MSTTRNLGWLRVQLARLLNFDENSPDAAFLSETSDDPWGLVDNFAQEAYEAIVTDAINDIGRPEMFADTFETTWGSSDVTFALPDWLERTAIIELRDITNDTLGTPIWVQNRGPVNSTELWWADQRTLQWGTAGPGIDKTIKIHYCQPEEMEGELAEPKLIPFRFRQYWKWAAAVIARRYKDEDTIPKFWLLQEATWKKRFHDTIKHGSPLGPAKSTVEPEDDSYFNW